MCDKMAISAYILKIVEKDPFLRLQVRAMVHSLSSGKGKMFLCAACHAFTPHVNAWKN